MPRDCPGGGMGGFGIDWYITSGRGAPPPKKNPG